MITSAQVPKGFGWSWLATLLVFFLAGSDRIPGVNESHYWAKAMHAWDPTWGGPDFFLSSPDTHWLFYHSVGTLTLLPLSQDSTLWIARGLQWVFQALAWTWMMRSITRSSWWIAGTAAAFLSWVRLFHLSGEWVAGGVEAKGFAYACVWLSVGLSLTGFGLTLRSIESRIGRISLQDYHGLYQQTPGFAGFFLLTGLASIGFPGTIGFIAMELLVEGAVGVYPIIGAVVVVVAALNGIAVLHAYFRIFTGRRSTTQVSLRARMPERVSVLLLTLLIIGGGLVPGPGIASRYHAAIELGRHRHVGPLGEPAIDHEYSEDRHSDAVSP